MATQGGGNQVWVWQPAASDRDVAFQHPSDLPFNDEGLSQARFVEQLRGPWLARISPATLLQMKGSNALIAEKGATREVPKPVILPWYEGLLLLEEIEVLHAQGGSARQVKWCDDELRGVLEQERSKFRGQLSSALYTEKRLTNTAVTGMRFIDGEDKEWAYRRENVRGDIKAGLTAEGEEAGGFFRIRDIVGYLPPWEAFCHEKCGLYQDFYKVRWEYPFSEVDYSRVENGCSDSAGATWEPDECLPAHLDPLRLAAKRAWVRRRRQREQQAAEERQQQQQQQQQQQPPQAPKRPTEPEPPAEPNATQPSPSARRTPPAPALAPKRQEGQESPATQAAAKRARTRRDGAPLERDLVRSACGHDFAPGDAEESFSGIRSGWPRRRQDYPKGYGVANPPGFCFESCDCMDDQRPQRAWEMHKSWLEDRERAAAAESAVEELASQTGFVRRRGQVSKQHYLETSQNVLPNSDHAQAAADLASAIERAMMVVLKALPLPSLAECEEVPVRIPALAVLFEDLDYEPLCFKAELPPGVRLDADDGQLAVEGALELPQPLHLKVELSHFERRDGVVPCSIVPDRPAGRDAWMEATPALAQHFDSPGRCQLEPSVREALQEHLSQVYSFQRRSARECALGEWLAVMSRVLRMLRSVGVADVALTGAHKALPLRAAAKPDAL